MSSFMCEHCRTIISDSPNGYTTGCEHYPPDIKGTDEAWEERKLGNDERYVAPYEDTDHKISRLEYMVEILEMQAVDLRRELTEANAQHDLKMLQLQAAETELEEQARLLGISGSREAKLLAELVELDHCRMEAERAEALAKENAALKAEIADAKDLCGEGPNLLVGREFLAAIRRDLEAFRGEAMQWREINKRGAK